jgi:tetratricopeptide (TPR) repeat protein
MLPSTKKPVRGANLLKQIKDSLFKAENLRKQEKFSEALAVCDEALTACSGANLDIELKSHQCALYALAGHCACSLNNTNQVIDYLEKAYAINPTSNSVIINLCQAYLKQKKYKSIQTIFQEVVVAKYISQSDRAEIYDALLNHIGPEETNFLYAANDVDADKKLKDIAIYAAANGKPNAMYYYDVYMHVKYSKSKNFTAALISAVKYCKHPLASSLGYFHVGQTYQEMNKIELAITNYRKVIDIWTERDPSVPTLDQQIFSTECAAHALAKIHDGSLGETYADSVKAFEYYKLAGSLGKPESNHDLGYKYQMGEDTEADVDQAIIYYRLASSKDFLKSRVTLGHILVNIKKIDIQEGLEHLTIAFEQDEDNQSRLFAAEYLGTYYLTDYQNKLADNASADELEPIAKKAVDFLKISVASPHRPTAWHNLGCTFALGIGVKKNCIEAINCLQKAYTMGLEDSLKGLIRLYVILITSENDHTFRKKYLSDFQKFCNDNNIEADLDVLVEHSELRHQSSLNLERSIFNYAYDNSLELQTRIENILNTPLTNLCPTNLSTIIDKLGFLTEKTLKKFDFHLSKQAHILILIRKVLDYLNEDTQRFTSAQLVQLIRGISKFNLNGSLELIPITVAKLFQQVKKDLNTFTLIEQVNICFATTRLDPGIIPYAILKQITRSLLAQIDKLDQQSDINLLYTVCLLNLPERSKAWLINLGPLVKKIIPTLVSTTNIIPLHQTYLALSFLSINKLHTATITTEVLNNLAKQILKLPPLVSISKLQSEVIRSLDQFVDNSTVEARVDIFSVDALVEFSPTQKFILEVDGPTHYLHGINKPVPGLRMQIRDLLLRTHYPLVTVPYYQWKPLQTDNDQIDFLRTKLKTINIELPDQPVQNHRYRLFSAAPQQPTKWRPVSVVSPTNSPAQTLPNASLTRSI